MLGIAPHPLLDLGWLAVEWPAALGDLETPAWLRDLLRPEAAAPLGADDETRRKVRDLLRQAGFKPTGRSKPSAEYLLRAARDGTLASINPAVDCGNAVSLHSGLPISVIDLDRARPPLWVDVAPQGARYVFNPSGQEIDVGKLLCLADAEGPCANAVKDAQRTKTDGRTRRTLSIVWGTRGLPGRTGTTRAWYEELTRRLGGSVAPSG